MSILIKNIDILTMKEDKTVKNGYIIIENNKITHIGETLPQRANVDTVIDGEGKLAMPGLINTHTHSPMTLLRSYADDMNLEKWLFDYIFPAEEKLTQEYVYWGSLLGIAEMIKSGTTTFADMYFLMEDVAKASMDAGIRACLSRGCQKFDDKDEKSHIRLQENVKLYKNYHSPDGLITVFIGPHAVYTCTPQYLQECYDVARDLKTGLHIHLAETKTEVDNCLEKYGKTPIEHCNDLGILDENVLGAHCVHLSPSEIDILRDAGVQVSHNPTSNLKLASGVAPIAKYLDKGINVCLGTDGASSNNNLNMFEEMHLAGIINKGVNYDSTLVSAYEVLKMATVNGAKGISRSDIGKLEEGKKADIIIVDIDKPHFYPKHNIVSNLIYSAQGSDVDTVIVNGNVLLNKGEFTSLDIEKVKFEVQNIYNKIF